MLLSLCMLSPIAVPCSLSLSLSLSLSNISVCVLIQNWSESVSDTWITHFGVFESTFATRLWNPYSKEVSSYPTLLYQYGACTLAWMTIACLSSVVCVSKGCVQNFACSTLCSGVRMKSEWESIVSNIQLVSAAAALFIWTFAAHGYILDHAHIDSASYSISWFLCLSATILSIPLAYYSRLSVQFYQKPAVARVNASIPLHQPRRQPQSVARVAQIQSKPRGRPHSTHQSRPNLQSQLDAIPLPHLPSARLPSVRSSSTTIQRAPARMLVSIDRAPSLQEPGAAAVVLHTPQPSSSSAASSAEPVVEVAAVAVIANDLEPVEVAAVSIEGVVDDQWSSSSVVNGNARVAHTIPYAYHLPLSADDVVVVDVPAVVIHPATTITAASESDMNEREGYPHA